MTITNNNNNNDNNIYNDDDNSNNNKYNNKYVIIVIIIIILKLWVGTVVQTTSEWRYCPAELGRQNQNHFILS